MRGRREVANDEEPLARLDEPEFAPRDFFDGRRVVVEATDFLAEPRVLGACGPHLRLELRVLLARPDEREGAAFTSEAVEYQEADEEGEGEEETTAATPPTARVCLADGTSGSHGGHQATVVP